MLHECPLYDLSCPYCDKDTGYCQLANPARECDDYAAYCPPDEDD